MKFRKDLVLRKVGKDYIIVDPSQGAVDMSKVFTLNATAAYIWDSLNGKDFQPNEAADLLKDKFDIDSNIAEADAQNIINLFRSENMIVD